MNMLRSVATGLVDAHQHFWNPRRVPQPWLRREHRVLDRPFEPPDLVPLLEPAAVARTVVVQSATGDADTDYLFEVVDDLEWVGAVVAWVRLDAADTTRSRLSELVRRPKLRGIRHLVQLEPDPHWILRPEVQEGLAVVAEAGLVLELPAEFPNHLVDVPELARRYPELTLVIDHLAKPPVGTPAMERWRDELASAAQFPNVHAKVSGLAGEFEPAIEAALRLLGPSRLMVGSDWPVSLLHAGYVETIRRLSDAVTAVAGSEASEILSETASRVYRLT
jgi:L-fuconolactonase